MAVKPMPDDEATVGGGGILDTQRFPYLYGALRGLARVVARLYWRIEIDGAARVPRTGPVILAPVHRSNVDFLVATVVTERKVFYMAKDTLWRAPRFGRFLEWAGAFPVHRQGADRQAVQRSQAVLEGGGVLILFPEGTRQAGPVVAALHEGAAFLSARTGAPIVPVGIGGTAEAMPKGSKFVRPVKVHVVVGEPIPAPPAPGRVPRRQLHEVTGQLQAELQRVYDTARTRADPAARRH